jgi:hypothetical protein
MLDEGIASPAPKATLTPPATYPLADQQTKASEEEALQGLGVWLLAAAVCAVVVAGVFFLPDLRDAEPAEPRARPSAPAPEKPRTQEPTEDPDALEDMLHPAG